MKIIIRIALVDSDDSREWENVTERDNIIQQIKFTVSPKVIKPQNFPSTYWSKF